MAAQIDNLIQLFAALLGAVLSGVCYLKSHRQVYFLMVGFYGCFALGALYWTLYLFLFSQTPQVFYVSEVGWISSVLFLLILQDKLALADGKGRSTRAAWLTPAVGVPLMVFFCTYGDILSNLIWCGLIMLVSFRAICGLSQKRARAFHAAALCFAVAEYALWTAGCFFESDSLRSPCFYLDLLLTGTVLALFPATRRAVEA